MTTFTTEDRKEAEKELPSTGSSEPIFGGAGFIWNEPIPFFGWWKIDNLEIDLDQES